MWFLAWVRGHGRGHRRRAIAGHPVRRARDAGHEIQQRAIRRLRPPLFAHAHRQRAACCDKLPAQRKQQLQSYRLLRGSLDGAPGSWVRLTEIPRGRRRRDLGRSRPLHRHALRAHRAVPDDAARRRARPDGGVPAVGSASMCCRATSARCADDVRCQRPRTASTSTRRVVHEIEAGVYTPADHAPDRNLADRRYGFPGRGKRRSHRRHAGAAQHRRRHFQRAGGPAGAGHRRAPDAGGRGSRSPAPRAPRCSSSSASTARPRRQCARAASRT